MNSTTDIISVDVCIIAFDEMNEIVYNTLVFVFSYKSNWNWFN
jgi:hypothetical protein